MPLKELPSVMLMRGKFNLSLNSIHVCVFAIARCITALHFMRPVSYVKIQRLKYEHRTAVLPVLYVCDTWHLTVMEGHGV
jgi:hypothetical protein